jgi:hypothetical protein
MTDPVLQKAWEDFQKSRADLQHDIPGFVDVIDKHEELVRIRLDLIEKRIARQFDIKERAKSLWRLADDNYGWGIAGIIAIAIAANWVFGETRESCIQSATKRSTDAGARIAYGECDRRFPKPSK